MISPSPPPSLFLSLLELSCLHALSLFLLFVLLLLFMYACPNKVKKNQSLLYKVYNISRPIIIQNVGKNYNKWLAHYYLVKQIIANE